jgi:peptide-methionine (S)-S-oxide reductase
MEIAIFAAGCFWGVEEEFRLLPGVISTEVGYTGGTTINPTYEEVCTSRTGHAEAVKIEFDPEKISYRQLLEVFFENHNPTQLNYQGFDVGPQYRSAIFYQNQAQKSEAEKAKNTLQNSGKFKRPIVTKIQPSQPFYKAEDYHQKYLYKRGLDSCHI